MPDSRRGLILGALAYTLWGTFPLYWTLLEPGGAVEILAHRIVGPASRCSLILVLWRRVPQLKALLHDRRKLLLICSAAVVISFNWGGYIWGVNNGRVVETSLGYFINPLVTVLMGVLILGERLRPLQWVAMGIAFVAVVVLTIDYGRPPWVALLLAFSFGTYGLLKKQAGVGAAESITVETLVLTPVALAYVVVARHERPLQLRLARAGPRGPFTTTGIITAVPLMLFGAAAIRVSMVSLGPAAVPRADDPVRARPRSSSTRRCRPAGGSASAWSGSRS